MQTSLRFLAVGGALAIAAAGSHGAARFTLRPDLVDFSRSAAQPGQVVLPLQETNTNLEIVDWSTAETLTNHMGQFIVRFKEPTAVGTVFASGVREVFFETESNVWQTLSAGREAGRTFQTLPLPPSARTWGLKFTVAATPRLDATNGRTNYSATLPFVALMPVRVLNLSAEAKVLAGSVAQTQRDKTAPPRLNPPEILIDGEVDARRNFATAESNAWIMLTWAEPQKIRGVAALAGREETGLADVVLEGFVGQGDPLTSTQTNDWEEAQIVMTSPGPFRSMQVAILRYELTVRALRLRRSNSAPLSLGEFLAFSDLHEEPVPAAGSRKSSGTPKVCLVPKVAKDKIKVDGDATDWPAERHAGFALAYDATNLYVLYQGRGDQASFVNRGTNLMELFATGDAVEVQLQTRPGLNPARTEAGEGDIRLCFAPFRGQPVGLLYEYKTSGFVLQPVSFGSLTNKTTCDKVRRLDEAQVAVLRGEGTLSLEAAVPLAAIHLDPAGMKQTRGDLGRLVGQPGAAAVARRIYWSNQQATNVSHIAAQAALQPDQWGVLRFGE